MKMNLVRQRIIVVILGFVLIMVSGCEYSKTSNVEDSDSISCENKDVLKILNEEPAIVRKQCFEHIGRVDAFFFELENLHSEVLWSVCLFPAGEIPQQFREDGLSVYISGNVISCYVLGGCVEPNIRLAYIPLFELKSIKINK